MYKATTEATHWFRRDALYSTMGSRKGVNLLGWEEIEKLKPEQQREAFKLRVKQIDHLIMGGNLSDCERKKLGQIKHSLELKMNAIRPKKRNLSGLASCFMEVANEKLTKPQFMEILNEAKRRLDKRSIQDTDAAHTARKFKERILTWKRV